MKHSALSLTINKIAVTLLLVMPLITVAQTETNRNFRLGFTTSPTFGWLKYDRPEDVEGDGLRTGFSYGVLGDFGFSDNYYFGTAVTVTTMNAKTQPLPADASSSAIYKLQYIEIPLTLKLKSNPIQNSRFYGQFGLAAAVKIGAKQDGTIRRGDVVEIVNDADISSSINAFRLGLLFGAGAEWRIAENIDLLAGISYNNGLSDIFDTNDKAKNSYLSLNLGVFF